MAQRLPQAQLFMNECSGLGCDKAAGVGAPVRKHVAITSSAKPIASSRLRNIKRMMGLPAQCRHRFRRPKYALERNPSGPPFAPSGLLTPLRSSLGDPTYLEGGHLK